MEKKIRCFPYVQLSDVPRLQQTYIMPSDGRGISDQSYPNPILYQDTISQHRTLFHIAISMKYCPGGYFNIGHYNVLHLHIIYFLFSLQLNITYTMYMYHNWHKSICMSHAILMDSSHFLYNIHHFYFERSLQNVILLVSLRKFQHYIVFKSETNEPNLDGTCLGGPLTNVCFLC